MDKSYTQYTEKLVGEFSAKHKVTEKLEIGDSHLHKQLEMVFTQTGNLKCRFESSVVGVPENGIILSDQMDFHYSFVQEGSGVCDRYVIYFSPGYIPDFSTSELSLLECFLLRADDRPVVLLVPKERWQGFICLLNKMIEYDDTNGEGEGTLNSKKMHMKLLFGECLLQINDLSLEQYGVHNSITHQSHAQIVYDIYDYVGSHYNEELSMDDVCKLFLIDRTQLYNTFKEISGLIISEYIMEHRITKTKDLLVNNECSVEITSQAVGHQNISSFSRTFKSRTGSSPIRYRRKQIIQTFDERKRRRVLNTSLPDLLFSVLLLTEDDRQKTSKTQELSTIYKKIQYPFGYNTNEWKIKRGKNIAYGKGEGQIYKKS